MISVVLVFLSLASQYSPGVTERVIVNRQTNKAVPTLPQVLPVTDGYIAVFDCANIGQIWWARNPIHGEWESFLIFDCARPDNSDGTRTWMVEKNIAFEVDYETAVRWQTVGELVKIQWAKEKPGRMVLGP